MGAKGCGNATIAGESLKNVGADLKPTTHVVLYKWVLRCRENGDRGVMSKSERALADGFPTRKGFEYSVLEDVTELKRLAAELMVQRTTLEQELELLKKRGRPPRPTVKPQQDPHSCGSAAGIPAAAAIEAH